MGREAFTTRSGTLLLEREDEVETLDLLLKSVAEGEGACALIEGEAGVGKSRLLRYAREAAGEGVRVLTARASELEGGFPFGVVRQIFEPVLREEWARSLLAEGSSQPAATVFRLDAAPAEGGGAAPSFAVLHGLYWLAVQISDRGPLLITVDDAHWCDPASLRYLAHLAGRIEGLPILLMAVARTDHTGSDADALAEIARRAAAATIVPKRLSETAVDRVVSQRLGAQPDREFADACHRATSGNPLLLHQLLATLAAERVTPRASQLGALRELGPRAVSRSILLRIARLGPEAAGVARAAAVLGAGETPASVAQLTGLGEHRVLDALDALARTEIIASEASLEYVHPLIREAVYREIPAGERLLMHRRAAELVRDAGGSDDAVAAHLVAAPGRSEEWAVELLRRAAQTAIRQGASDSAVTYLRRALEEPPDPDLRPQLLLELGMAETLVDAHSAAAHLAEATSSLGDAAQRAAAAIPLARVQLYVAAPADAAATARTARSALADDHSDVAHELEALEHTAFFFGASEGDSPARLRALREHDLGSGIGAVTLKACALLWSLVTDGTAEETARDALAVIQAQRGSDRFDLLYVPPAAMALTLTDRIDEALAVWEDLTEQTHRRGSTFALRAVALGSAYSLAARGELVDADTQFRAASEAMATWNSTGGSGGTPLAVTQHARVVREMGDIAGAAEIVASVAPVPGSLNEMFWYVGHVEQLLAEKRHADALNALDNLPPAFKHASNPALAPLRSLRALALDGLGRSEEAARCAEAELPVAERWGAPSTVARTLRVIGTLRRTEGLPMLQRAAELLQGSPVRLERAKTLAALGRTLRLARRPTDARTPLKQAFDLAQACGAEPLVEEVRAELLATGTRPRSGALQGPDALTASERRVAEMAAAGHTNREIAQTLFITPKTVEVHLSNAYRKLSIQSRQQLQGALTGTPARS